VTNESGVAEKYTAARLVVKEPRTLRQQFIPWLSFLP